MLPRYDASEFSDEYDQGFSLFDVDDEKRNQVRSVLSEVRNDGWSAVRRYTREYDDVEPDDNPVTREGLDRSWSNLEKDQQDALREMCRRVRRYQDSILPESSVITDPGGGLLGEISRPIDTVGCYVPGGRVPLPSSVIMTAYVAECAGVNELVICSPPADSNGRPADSIRAAVSLLEDPKLFGIGGIQAIGAMTFGAGSVPQVDFIAGPGNIFVTLAKKEIYGEVGIDMIAGPSEITVLAEPEFTRFDYVAWDLLSQAEHDPLSKSILLTLSDEFIRDVEDEIEHILDDHPRPDPVREALDNSAAVQVESIEQGIDLVNEIAPEHLELHLEDSEKLSKQCRNAGAIFCGPSNPEPIGDYMAGPSHTLPTGGSARFFSPLSVRSFRKFQSLVALDEEGFDSIRDDASIVAEMESLPAHHGSLGVRK